MIRNRAWFTPVVTIAVTCAAPDVSAQTPDVFADVDRLFEEFQLDARVPGLVYGVVIDGRLVHIKAMGVQDVETKRPVTADTLFRIASMTKSFTALSILKLRTKAGCLSMPLRKPTCQRFETGNIRRRTRRGFACASC